MCCVAAVPRLGGRAAAAALAAGADAVAADALAVPPGRLGGAGVRAYSIDRYALVLVTGEADLLGPPRVVCLRSARERADVQRRSRNVATASMRGDATALLHGGVTLQWRDGAQR